MQAQTRKFWRWSFGTLKISNTNVTPPNLVCLRTPRRGPTVNFEGEIWGCVQTVYKFWNTMVLYTDYAYRLILLKRESFRPFWQKIISDCWIPSVEMHFCKAFWDQAENNTVVGLERRKFDWCLGKVANLDFSFMIIIWMISLIYFGAPFLVEKEFLCKGPGLPSVYRLRFKPGFCWGPPFLGFG